MFSRQWQTLISHRLEILAFVAVSILLGVAFLTDARADSITGKYSHNGVRLYGRTRVAFETAPPPVVWDRILEENDLALPILGSDAEVHLVDGVFPDAPVTPGDIANIDFKSHFEFGAPYGTVADDLWTLEVSGHASAMGAMLGGRPADAFVSGFATVNFFIDFLPGGPSRGSAVGQLVFDPIPELSDKETALGTVLRVRFLDDTGVLFELGPGSPRTAAPLIVGKPYQIAANYDLHVPHGVDPPFQFTLGATIVPEPSSIVLSLLLLIGVSCLSRQHFLTSL